MFLGSGLLLHGIDNEDVKVAVDEFILLNNLELHTEESTTIGKELECWVIKK